MGGSGGVFSGSGRGLRTVGWCLRVGRDVCACAVAVAFVYHYRGVVRRRPLAEVVRSAGRRGLVLRVFGVRVFGVRVLGLRRIVRVTQRLPTVLLGRSPCLVRSLVQLRLLGLGGAGHPGVLVLGVPSRHPEVPWFAHAWVELNGLVLGDRSGMEELMRFPCT